MNPLAVGALGSEDLVRAFKSFVAEIGRDTDVAVHIDIEDTEIPPGIGLSLYHVGRDGTMNTLTYAQASDVWISVQDESDDVVLRLRDNGVGFDGEAPSPQIASALTLMRQRTEFGGGTFDVRSAVGEGTLVTVRFPIKKPLWADVVLDLSRDLPLVSAELRRLVEYGPVELRDGATPDMGHLVRATERLKPPMKLLHRALGVLPGHVSPSAFELHGSVAGGILQVELLDTACRQEQADAAAKGRPWRVAGARKVFYELGPRAFPNMGRRQMLRALLRRGRWGRREWNEVLSWRVWTRASAAADTFTSLVHHLSDS